MFRTSRTRQSLRRHNRIAPFYAVANGALQALADVLMQPVILLAAVAFLLGGSNTQIAAFPVIALATWALAPLLFQILGSFFPRPYPIVFSAGIIRFVAALVLGVIGFRIDEMSTDRIVGSLLVIYLVYQAAASVANQASASLILDSVPRYQQRSTFGRRNFAAVVVAVTGALACWNVFRSDQTFQRSVGLVLMLAALSVCSATWFLLNIPGSSSSSVGRQGGWLVADMMDAVRQAPFRRYIAYKVLLALVASTDPFLIVFGFQELGMRVEFIGWALVAYATGQLIGLLAWPRWIAHHSPRVPFQIATFLRLLLLTWTISLPTFATSGMYTDRFDDTTVAMRAFATGFVLLGLAASVGNSANQRYLLDISPREAVPGSIAATNLVAALFAFAPFGVAWAMRHQGLDRILWVAIGIAILALLASGLLIESRVRIRTSAGSWRSRRQAPRIV